MAWIFELAIECGPSRDLAFAQRDHFDDLRFSLDGGTDGFCIVHQHSIAADEEQNWWLSVLPILQGHRPMQHSDCAGMLQETALILYDRLKSAPSFRFALAGVETNQFNTLGGLNEIIGHSSLSGLVLQMDLYLSFGNPGGFEPFTPNYVWRPFVTQKSDVIQ